MWFICREILASISGDCPVTAPTGKGHHLCIGSLSAAAGVPKTARYLRSEQARGTPGAAHGNPESLPALNVSCIFALAAKDRHALDSACVHTSSRKDEWAALGKDLDADARF